MMKKEIQPDCIPLWYLKAGEPFNCFGIEREHIAGQIYPNFFLGECNNKNPDIDLKWNIIESGNDAIQICQHVWGECISIEKNDANEYSIGLNKTSKGAVSQLWKMNTKLNQLMNVKYGSCLMVSVWFSSVGGTVVELYSCNRNDQLVRNVANRKMWILEPLNNCLIGTISNYLKQKIHIFQLFFFTRFSYYISSTFYYYYSSDDKDQI